MATPFMLVRNSISHDTIEAARTILEGAGRGEIIGFAFCVMYGGKRYAVNAAGEAYDSPTFSRGMAAALDDFLRDRVNELKGQG